MSINGKLLIQAAELINGKRRADYGDPATCFERVAVMWSAYIGKEVSAHDVACLMALLKLAREASRHKPDNLLDAAGYIGLAADMAD